MSTAMDRHSFADIRCGSNRIGTALVCDAVTDCSLDLQSLLTEGTSRSLRASGLLIPSNKIGANVLDDCDDSKDCRVSDEEPRF